MITVEDFEKYAKDHLPQDVYNHVSGGADDQHTLNDNCHAFQRYRIRPRVLRDVSKRELSATILGHKVPFPIGISPTALQKLACSDGELAMAKAAASMGTIMVVSTYATTSIEDVASATPAGNLWFQLYIFTDRGHTEKLIHTAERAGYKAIVVTVDTPYAGKKLNDERYGGFNPQVSLPNIGGGNFEYHPKSYYDSLEISPSATWDDIRWVQRLSRLPVVAKGIISGDSAREAVENRVAGIVVSNHGGRQLDGVPATFIHVPTERAFSDLDNGIDVLPEVLAATEGTNVEVYMDGGVRCGTDVMKALAIGAKAVFIGRPAWWGLVYKGEEGVQEVLKILRDELSLAMALSGCASISDLNPSLVVPGPHVSAKY